MRKDGSSHLNTVYLSRISPQTRFLHPSLHCSVFLPLTSNLQHCTTYIVGLANMFVKYGISYLFIILSFYI